MGWVSRWRLLTGRACVSEEVASTEVPRGSGSGLRRRGEEAGMGSPRSKAMRLGGRCGQSVDERWATSPRQGLGTLLPISQQTLEGFG